MNGLQLIATGGALPGRTITNDALSRMVDTSDAWITSRTGIRTRHYCTEAKTPLHWPLLPQSRRCSAAALPRQTLPAAFAPPFPHRTPPKRCLSGAGGAALPENRPALDVNAACSGFLYGTAVARGLLATLGGSTRWSSAPRRSPA